jgi:hypothetical protein
MTEFKKALKNIIMYGALYYAVISLPFIIYATVSSSGASPSVCQTCGVDVGARYLEGSALLSVLFLAFVMAVGTSVMKIAGISKTVAVITHVGCFNIGFLLFMAIRGEGFTRSVIATVIFAIAYVIERVIQSAVVKATKRSSKAQKKPTEPVKKNEKKPYTSQFSK